jgi:TRAP-type C4-dicarboxylate transport system permease large subunit
MMMKRSKLLVIIGMLTFLVGGGLFLAGQSPALAIVLGAIAAFLVFALWEPPPKHKEFSDADRMKATLRNSSLPELPVPDIPLKRDKNRGKTRKRR